MILTVFHGVQCTTLYCVLVDLIMGNSAITRSHQPQSHHYHHQVIHYMPHQAASSLIMSLLSLFVIRMIYSTLLDNLGKDSSDAPTAVSDRMGVWSWTYLIMMFILSNAMMRSLQVIDGVTKSRSLFGEFC